MATANDALPIHQFIDGVSGDNGAQVISGIVYGDVTFAGGDDSAHKSEQRIRACRDALFLTDPENDRADLISAKGKRTPGTCEWILENRIFKEWLHGDVRLLSICGGPGQGKTMLSIFLSEKLQTDKQQTVYYFCNNENDKRNSASCVLRGLLWQMISTRPELGRLLLPAMETPSWTSREALWRIFTQLCTQPDADDIYCIVDGLDECDIESSRWLTTKLVDLLGPENNQPQITYVKVAIVSRRFIDLEQISTKLNLDPDNDDLINLDVQNFISTRVKELSRFPGYSHDFGREAEKELLLRADGKFLWVGFAMAELLQQNTLSEVRQTMGALPKGLPALYDRMLLRMKPEHRDKSLQILRWLALAIRPVSLDELAAILGVTASTSLSVEQTLSDYLRHCGPLVEKKKNKEAALVHQSARDYLLRETVNDNPYLESFRIEPEQAHYVIAKECLDYMMHSGFPNASDGHDSQRTDFLNYAIRYWPEHARLASENAGKLLTHPSHVFMEKSPFFRAWAEAASRFDHCDGLPSGSLHVACYFGIAPWAHDILGTKRRKLLHRGWVNRCDRRRKPAIIYAVEENHQNLIVLLLDHRADINAKSKAGRIALQSAALKGIEAVVRLLLDRGADITAKDNTGRAALHIAALGSNEAVVRLLLDRGADITAKDNVGWAALHIAAFGGNEAAVRLLLDRGADITAKDSTGRAALHIAVSWGNEAVVRLLLTHGADITAKDKFGKTALHYAAWRGYEAAVRLLLDRGADIAAKDISGQTALQVAVESEQEAVVDILTAAERT